MTEFVSIKKIAASSGCGIYEIDTGESTIYAVNMRRGVPKPENVGVTVWTWKSTERMGAEMFFDIQVKRREK